MSTTQTIIVYRNPIEAQLWESGLMFPLVAAGCFAVIAMYLVGSLLQKRAWSKNKFARWMNSQSGIILGVVGLGAFASVIKFMV